MNLETILAAIRAGVAIIPEGAALITELRDVLAENDRAEIDAALSRSTAEADQQHRIAQEQ